MIPSTLHRLLTAIAASSIVACASPPLAEAPRPEAVPDTLPAEPLMHVPPELPRALPHQVGFDEARLALVDSLIGAAIASHVTPGAALAIGRHGLLVRLRGYGYLDWRPGFAAVDDSSIYDLASLTKVVGTTTAIMLLVENGRLNLDAPVQRYLPEFTGRWKEEVTARSLLAHASGLPAGGPAWRQPDREAVVRYILGVPLEYRPGTASLYSDYDFVLLGEIVERLSGERLDAFLRARVFEPLGMRETGFNPRTWWLTHPEVESIAGFGAATSVIDRVAPTEVDREVRGVHIHGDVHDPIAYAMSGVAGNAGLFSSARDMAVFAQMLLNGGSYGGVDLLDPRTIQAFTSRQYPFSSRALGWDTPTGTSSAGRYFPPSSFGHTGYTGTSLWIDPEHDLFVVLLTNRVNPTAATGGQQELRRAVHDAVQLSLVDAAVEPVGP